MFGVGIKEPFKTQSIIVDQGNSIISEAVTTFASKVSFITIVQVSFALPGDDRFLDYAYAVSLTRS